MFRINKGDIYVAKTILIFSLKMSFVYFITKMLYCIFIMRISKNEKNRKMCKNKKHHNFFKKIKTYTVVNMVYKIKKEM